MKAFRSQKIHNPLGIHIDPRSGATIDKYGRTFDHDEKEFARRRKDRTTPAYHACKLSEGSR